MQTATALLTIVAGIIGLAFSFFIIKYAVKSAFKEALLELGIGDASLKRKSQQKQAMDKYK